MQLDSFKTELREYRENGAEALREKLPAIIARAMDSEASKDYLHFTADVCMDLKAFREASALLREGARRFGENDVLLNLLAFCAWEQGAEDEALAAYRESVARNPKNTSSLRGACFLAIEKESPDAVEYCRRFYERSGRTHEAAVWYATALHNSGRREEVEKLVKNWQKQFGPSEELDGFASET